MTLDRGQVKSRLLKPTLSASALVYTPPEKKIPLFGVPLHEVMQQQEQRGEVCKVPVFLDKAIKCLRAEKVLREEGLFRISGGLGEINSMKDKLESGQEVDFAAADPHAVSGLIKSFFRELPGQLIPTDLNNYAATIASTEGPQRELEDKLSEYKFILRQLPAYNYNVLRAFLSLLVEVAAHADVNKMNENNLLRGILL